MSVVHCYRIGKPPAGTPKPVIPPAPPKPRNDASHAIKHGSASGVSSGVCNPRIWIIATLLAFASSTPAIAQEPLGGPIIDRIESRLESARESLDRSTAESKAWRDRFDRVDRFERGGKIGSRIGTFLDRVERIFWLVVVVFVVACIAVGLACAAYGIERVSAGAQAVLKVVQTFADTLRAWRGKA